MQTRTSHMCPILLPTAALLLTHPSVHPPARGLKVTAAGLDKNALPRWRELEESFEPTVALNVSAGMLQV